MVSTGQQDNNEDGTLIVYKRETNSGLDTKETPFITMALTGVTTQWKNDFPLGG